MKREQAKMQIYLEWSRWLKKNPDITDPCGNDGFVFYAYLQTQRPHLLNFRSKKDKWQDVHCWLLNRRLVTD